MFNRIVVLMFACFWSAELSSATGDPSFDGENGAFMYFLVGQGIKMLDLSNNQLSGLFSTGWLTV